MTAVFRTRHALFDQSLQFGRIEVRVQFADAFQQRRVRGEYPVQSRREQHMRDLLGICRDELRTFLECRDLQQCTLESGRVARELHGGRIGQTLALARNGRLQDASGQQSQITQHHRRKPHAHPAQAPAPVAIVAAARREIEHQPADDRDHQQAEDRTHELDVQAHVAVENVGELVPDHALQFVAVQMIERALGDGDAGIARRMPRGKRIDGRLLLQHIDLRHGHARGDGHLLNDIAQPLARRVGGVAFDPYAAQRLGHDRAAAAQLCGLEQARQTDHPDDEHRDHEQRVRVAQRERAADPRRRSCVRPEP